MASTVPPKTWEGGFSRPAGNYGWDDDTKYITESGERAHYTLPEYTEPPTSTIGNAIGLTHLRTWPTYYDGTAGSHPEWFKPAEEVDVLICGAGPFGLQLGLILARQGISFRIIDKATTPCLSGRADAVHPRGLELLHSWGLAHEATEEGPLINSTAVFRNGVKLFHSSEPTCDSRYKGAHVITQGQFERIYIRDLLRHRVLVERDTSIDRFQVLEGDSLTHPVRATLKNVSSGAEETVRAQYLIGADGAASIIREQLKIEFDGLATDIYWAIIDCRFKTDYPHMFGLSMIISAEHGGSIVIPREEGFTRFYVQISGEMARRLQEKRRARRNASSVGETRIDDHGITPEEALQQLNKIMAPWTIGFASPISWFSVWKVNERVARRFSSADLRVHLGGDAAHVHSVLGGFGFNSSLYDASNLGWKLGLCLRKQAIPSVLLPTYDSERRMSANRVIRCSGAYLRFICNSHLPLAALRGLNDNLESHDEVLPKLDGTTEADLQFIYVFYKRHAMFLLGVEWPIVESEICPPDVAEKHRAVSLRNGVRAPNPRVCFDTEYTAYLHDRMRGVSGFHILIFASDLQGPLRERLAIFSKKAFQSGGFFSRYGGNAQFNVILVTKALPYEAAKLLKPANGQEPDDLKELREHATVVYDDRVPDDDAHYWYGVNHARGAVVAVRPDLVVGVSVWPEDVESLEAYFGSFLLRQNLTAMQSAKDPVEILSREVSGGHETLQDTGGRPRRSIRSWFSSMLTA
ncbi:FAD binding domain-containing protein [Aspergillus cavernicola]|uniref:FAD binding domain-containing protein n=1 Tax=Aspergillus cavernicola TaxID=176166 RepID=A0ABR4IUR7_9EURO